MRPTFPHLYDYENGARVYEAAQRFRIPERDPCPLCGTRRDIGCKHWRAVA